MAGYRAVVAGLLCCGLWFFAMGAQACDPAGPPPAPWSVEQAAREMLYGPREEFTHVLYGRIAGPASSAELYPIDVVHAFRGQLNGRVHARIGTSSCHGIRPEKGLTVVLYGDEHDAFEIAASMYGDLVPPSETLYPALRRHAEKRAPVELKPWWKFW